jgi:hypothetical protein
MCFHPQPVESNFSPQSIGSAFWSNHGAGPSTMQPGSELDRMVSEQVMGSESLPDPFQPSTRIEHAWQVHRRMDQLPNHVLAAYVSELHRVLFARWRERTGARVIGPDMPGYLMEMDAESICRAAIKAVSSSGARQGQ